MSEGERKIARSAAKIQNQSIRALKDRAEMLCRARAPETVQFERQKMVQQIVARSDLRDHLAEFFGGFRFGGDAFRPGTFHRRGDFIHFEAPRRALAAIK